jgi:hypothetical protein
MTNESDSNSPTIDPQGQPPNQPSVIPPAPLRSSLPDDGKKKPDDTKGVADELAREFRTAEKWVIGTNLVLAIIGIVALCIYHGQLEVMRGQLGEIISSSPNLRNLPMRMSKLRIKPKRPFGMLTTISSLISAPGYKSKSPKLLQS